MDIPIRISNWLEGAVVEKAASNGNQQVVFSGQSTAIGKFNDAIAETSSKAYLMEWSTATHSKYINSVILEFWNTAYAQNFEDDVVIPFLSSLSGTLLQKNSGEYWCQQSLCKVDFNQVCKNSEGLSQDAALEVGPRPVLLALLGSKESKMSKEMVPCLNARHSAVETLNRAISSLYCLGVDISWNIPEMLREQPRPSKATRVSGRASSTSSR
ncbi:MAG: hypothetical protein GY738_17770, partial [Pseudoalteromonas sp.]|nr:hypothetical protein [Pseudoalteromonas sp.]